MRSLSGFTQEQSRKDLTPHRTQAPDGTVTEQ